MAAIFLLSAAVASGLLTFRADAAIDLYHIWGIATARTVAPDELGGPYTQRAAYAAVLNQLADDSDDPHYRRVDQARRLRGFDPTGTPVLYTFFAFLPRPFTAAHAVFRVLQYGAMLAAALLLGQVLGYGRWTGLLLSGLVMAQFGPFSADVTVGNVNAIQLLLVAVMLLLLRRGSQLAVDLFFASLALFVLLKPNLLPLAALLAGHVWAARGGRALARGAAVAAGCAVLLVALSSVYLGSASVWGDWWGYLTGGNRLLGYPIARGNWALPIVISRLTGGSSPYAVAAIVAVLLLGSVAAAAQLRARQGATPTRLAAATWRLGLADPMYAASIGAVLSIATAPLLWYHYLLVLVLPIFWLVAMTERWDAPIVIAALTFALYGPLLNVLGSALPQPVFVTAVSLSWLPLWIALLLRTPRGATPTSAAAA